MRLCDKLYEKIADKAATFLGFDGEDRGYNGKELDQLLSNSFLGSKKLCDYLCYRYFEPNSENFLLSEDVAGFMLEIAPLVGIDDKVVKSLNLFFGKELPRAGVLQFFLMASSDIDDFFEKWKDERTNKHPILQRITSSRIEYFKEQANNLAGSGKRLPRGFRIYVSYSKKCTRSYGLGSSRGNNYSELAEIKSFRIRLSDKLASLDLSPRICKEAELIRFVREFIEYGDSHSYSPKNKHDILSDQTLRHGNFYESRKKEFLNREKNISHRAYSFAKSPDFWSLAQNIEMLGSRTGSPLPARFCLSLSISNDLKTNKTLIARGKKVIDSAERTYSRHDRALQEEAGQWRDIIHSLVTKGEAALSESYCLFVSARADEIDKAESEIATTFSSNGFEILPLDYYHLEALLGSMPMHGSIYWSDLRRHKLVQTSLSSEIVSKLPIHAEWYGVPISGVPFIGRRGQVFNWNPYHRLAAGNYNVNVVGPSGVGKSVFLQVLAETMLAQNTRIFILDIGKSYASMAKLLSGEIIEFGEESSYTINPFAGLSKLSSREDRLNEGVVVYEGSELSQMIICAKELLSIMSGAGGEYELALLEGAIKEAIREYGYELDLAKFVEFLKKQDRDVLDRLGSSLFSYTPDGVFGKYFAGDNAAKFDKEITIFEFEHIKDQPKLISVILQTLLMQITSQFLASDRSRRFMIIVDEAWMLLDYAAGFLAAIARNLRRYGGSLVVCTQCFADLQTMGSSLENNGHRRAIFENSAWKVVLPPSSVADFEAHPEFKQKIPLIQSLSFERGKYSEMLLSSAGYEVVGRLMLDPFSAAIYSTEAEDFAFLDSQEKRGVSMDLAIDALIEQKRQKRAA